MPPRADIQINPPYAPALVRPVSPASSIGTRPPNDSTDSEDKLLSQEDFDKKCWENLRVDGQTDEELEAESRPIYYQYHRLEPERAAILHEQILKRLRDEVRNLQDNELFEQALLRGSQVGLDFQTPTGDIDTIMRSLLELGGKEGLVPNAGDNLGPSIMSSQASLYVPERETDTSQTTTGASDTRRAKGKRKA